jgi:hypothetical protein
MFITRDLVQTCELCPKDLVMSITRYLLQS